MATRYVASFTDAWIETSGILQNKLSRTSHLLQMRGLKPFTRKGTITLNGSHLLQMRGLKRCSSASPPNLSRSHLLQMRGLKLERRTC